MKRLLPFFLLFTFPVIMLLLSAFGGVWQFGSLLPESFSLHGFRVIASSGGHLRMALLVSVLYSISAAVLALLICLPAASLFARCSFRGKALWEAVLLAPALVPSVTFALGTLWVFIRSGLADSFAGVVLVLTAFSYPYMLRALTAGFAAIPYELVLTAENLGAGRLRTFLRIELPLLLPAVATGCSVVFLVSFSEYFLVYLIGGGVVPSYTGYLMPFLTGSDRQSAAALTLLFISVPLLLFFVTDRLTRTLVQRWQS